MSFEDQEATLQELADFIDSLPPEEQQAAMVSLGLQQANQLPYTFGGDYQPELGAQSFEGAGYTGGYNLPNFTTKGAVDPRDQAQMAASTTFAKNREGLLADNVFSAQAGPGAYAAGAFEPTVAYKGSVVDFPGERMLQGLAQTGGWQGMVAQRMLGIGTSDGRRRSSAEAMGEVRALMEADPAGLDKDAQALQTQVFGSLNAAKPGADGDAVDEFILEGGGASGTAAATKPKTAPGKTFDWSQYDLPGMQSWAEERQLELLKDRPREELFQDQTSGAYYDQAPEETPSAQSKWFADRGLTTPDKSYADQAYQEEILNRQDPGRQQGIQQEQYDTAAGQAAQGKLAQQSSQLDQMVAAFAQQMQAAQQQDATGTYTFPNPLTSGVEQGIEDQYPVREQGETLAYGQPAGTPIGQPPQAAGPGIRGGAAQAGGPRFPLDPRQVGPLGTSTVAPPGLGQRSANPELDGWIASQMPRNVQGEPIQPGPDYAKNPAAPLQVDLKTGATAPVFDFGMGQDANAAMGDMLAGLIKMGGRTEPYEFTAPGGKKGTIIPGSRATRPDEQKLTGLRQAAGEARQRYADQYSSDFQRMYSGGDFGRTYLQRGQMNQMAQQGRTPLNDEIMQRRLLLNALGLYQ